MKPTRISLKSSGIPLDILGISLESGGYLWILVRNRALPEADLDRLVAKVDRFGFNTADLIIVD